MRPTTTSLTPRRPRTVTVDLHATGIATLHHGTGTHVVLHSLPLLELTLPKTTHTAAWRWRGELVLTCSSHPYAARVEVKGDEVSGKVVDADSLKTVATVQGSLASGVMMTHNGTESVLLPPGAPPPPTIDLDDLGGRRMPLLWSVLHDALLFAPLPLRPLHVQGDAGGDARGAAALPPCIVVCEYLIYTQ